MPRLIAAVWVGAIVLSPCVCLAAAEDAPASTNVVVLDTAGMWRLHQSLAVPVVTAEQGPKPLPLTRRWLTTPTALPPEGWTAPRFDDSGWLRGTARRAGWTCFLSRLRLRGKFVVTDLAKVSPLRLSAAYQGGIVVYVNGTEVARSHVPAGAIDALTLADPYGDAPFLLKSGELVTFANAKRMPSAERQRLRDLRVRELTDVEIPAKALREGVNVVAVEVIRAPYPRAVLDRKPEMRGIDWFLYWNMCELLSVQVAGESADGLVPAATRPEGLQVFNSDMLAADHDLDFGDPAEPLKPIQLVGAANGSFSGKVVVASHEPVEGLVATISDLTGAAGVIPAASIRVRYGLPWGYEALYDPYGGRVRPSPYSARPVKMGALGETPPAIVKPGKISTGRAEIQTPNQPKPVAGAVAPVWVTVDVPADAGAGEYRGRLTIRTAGADPVDVPVRLQVVGWRLPDRSDYATWVELMQLPDTTAVEYGVDLWSDRHFELIARSMALMKEVGSSVLYVPLIAETNLGNAESMVRWIARPDGAYDYDFSVMERYLDTAAKHMGRPKIVAFCVWEIYLLQKEKFKPSATMWQSSIEARKEFKGKGPLVTVLDPATGKTHNEHLPVYAEPAAEKLWRPLFAHLREKMSARGLADAMMLGILSDVMPTKEEVVFLTELSGGMPWVVHRHHGLSPKPDYRLHGVARVGYQTRVWNISFGDGAAAGKYGRGWAKPYLLVDYERTRDINTHTSTKWRHLGEYNITGSQRGIGRIGGDNWAVIRDKKGRRKGRVADRYPHSDWRNLNLYSCILAPGPDGPVATQRFEAFREGLQECEARIFIERALADEAARAALPAELIARCDRILDERTLAMWRGMSPLQLNGPRYKRATSWRGRPGIAGHLWFVGSGWRQRSRDLYQAAADVADALGEQ